MLTKTIYPDDWPKLPPDKRRKYAEQMEALGIPWEEVFALQVRVGKVIGVAWYTRDSHGNHYIDPTLNLPAHQTWGTYAT